MSGGRSLYLIGALALAILGMTYGLWYAVFAEQQALDGMGGSLTASFTSAALRDHVASGLSLNQYREAKYAYDRQVDVHGHWIGLAMLLFLLGIAYDHLQLAERIKYLLGMTLLAGSFLFPLAVLLQTFSHDAWPRALAVFGSALVIIPLAVFSFAVLRRTAPGSSPAR